MALGRLATHVAGLPSWTNFTLDTEELNLTPDFKQEVANTRAELLAMFDKNVVSARGKIAAASDEDWKVIWTLKFAGNPIFSMPRSTVMRSGDHEPSGPPSRPVGEFICSSTMLPSQDVWAVGG